jgi:hypothetical protein
VINIPTPSAPIFSNTQFTHDANGNMTCRVESGITYLQTYNTENRIASIAKLDAGMGGIMDYKVSFFALYQPLFAAEYTDSGCGKSAKLE